MIIVRIFIHIMAFVRKELFGALRQPRLILSLVLGPFLILALFGLGYNGTNHFKTILVVPNQPDVSTNPEDYKDVIKQTFQLEKISKNEQEALAELNRGDVDVVIVVPSNALDEIYNGRSAKFPVYYRNMNPLQANYIEYSTYVYATEFDKVILRQALTASKPNTNELQDYSKQLGNSTALLDRDMQSGNLADAKLQVQNMRALNKLARDGLNRMILPGAGTENTPQQVMLGAKLTDVIVKSGIGQVRADLDNIDNKLNALDQGFNQGDLNSSQQRSNLDSVRQSTTSLGQKADKIAAIPPAVIVEPVLSDAKNQVSTPVNYINFYGPAVVILLLQHIGITLASLSNVRDRLIGAIELFRVAPIGPSQILTGKFLSFALMMLVLGAALIALITQVLGVPFVNFTVNWLVALAVISATIYASIGLGFLIAGLSKSESQAVQLSMIVLLGSIFFTGFVVPLTQFVGYVRYVGYIFPMTFGATGLQKVMLDDQPLDPIYILAPLIMGTIYLALGRFLYRLQYKMG